MSANGGADDIEMSASTDSHTIQSLVLDIYTHPHKAAARELIANAGDSHKVAGQTRPIELHLPNKSEPFFSIRDFGTGLDEKGMGHFTVIANSSKREDNNQTGALGIGRLAILRCSKIVELTNFYNGTETYYHWFIENGAIKLRKVLERDTQEPNGLFIKAKIESAHHSDWSKGAKQCRYMEVPVDGLEQKSKTDSDLFGTNWFRLGQETTWSVRDNNRLFILMCGMLYPYTETVHLPPGRWVLEVPPGSVHFTPNRDGLRYTDLTKRTCGENLKILNDEVRNNLDVLYKDEVLDSFLAAQVSDELFLHYYPDQNKRLSPNRWYRIQQNRVTSNRYYYWRVSQLGNTAIIIDDHKKNYNARSLAIRRQIKQDPNLEDCRYLLVFDTLAEAELYMTDIGTVKEHAIGVYYTSKVKPHTSGLSPKAKTADSFRSSDIFSCHVDKAYGRVKGRLAIEKSIPKGAPVLPMKSYELSGLPYGHPKMLKKLGHTKVYCCRPSYISKNGIEVYDGSKFQSEYNIKFADEIETVSRLQGMSRVTYFDSFVESGVVPPELKDDIAFYIKNKKSVGSDVETDWSINDKYYESLKAKMAKVLKRYKLVSRLSHKSDIKEAIRLYSK